MRSSRGKGGLAVNLAGKKPGNIAGKAISLERRSADLARSEAPGLHPGTGIHTFQEARIMSIHPGQPSDDVSSAPESGTVRDATSGNQPAHPDERMQKPGDTKSGDTNSGDTNSGDKRRQRDKDDPSHAGEEP
jgi:hypothetical protein